MKNNNRIKKSFYTKYSVWNTDFKYVSHLSVPCVLFELTDQIPIKYSQFAGFYVITSL